MKRILLAYADAGGGHRSAAEAIAEALRLCHGANAQITLADALAGYAPFPLNRVGKWYPRFVGLSPAVWGSGYWLSDGPRRVRALQGLNWPLLRTATGRFLRDHPADVIVSVYPMYVNPFLNALGKKRPPFVTVVTDMVSTHAWWYDPRTDVCVVPTEQARARALECGVGLSKTRVLGLPISPRFGHPLADKPALRRQLGWSDTLPTVLLTGGGDGIGPLAGIACAIDAAQLPCELAIVTGRNEALRRRLEHARWRRQPHIYGFVQNMPELMRSADALVSKAGPGSISEGFAAGLPMIMYGRIPGQETGNVRYVMQDRAGAWAPRPVMVVDVLRDWLFFPDQRAQVAANAARLARPNAATDIAELVWSMA